MTVVADSGTLYALYDADDSHHAAVRQVLEAERGPSSFRPRYLQKSITFFANFWESTPS